MIDQEVLSGHWEEAAGKLREKWEQLSTDDLHAFDGNVKQLIDKIQRVTGEKREEIERFLDQLDPDGQGLFAGLRTKVADAADQAADSAREGLQSLQEGYAAAERVVQQRPGQVVAMAFGLGLVAGLGAALLLRGSKQASKVSQAQAVAEHFGKQWRDAWAELKPDVIAKHFKG